MQVLRTELSQLGLIGKLLMIADTVLLVTASYDLAAPYVQACLERRSVPYFRLDTDRFPSEVQMSLDPKRGLVISDGERSIEGDEVKSVWYRRHVAPMLSDQLTTGIRDFCERETRSFLEGVLAALPTKRWLSSPQAIRTAERKPYQLVVADQLGFALPETIITNNQAEVARFAQERRLVAKAISSGYIAGPDGNEAIFTSVISPTDLEDLDGLMLAPVTFQEHVEKLSDIRLTVVGGELFAAEILSQERESSKVDWRATDDPELKHIRHELPKRLSERCLRLVSNLGLVYGAIDMALKPDGTYVFFEINPNGEWLWLEDQLGFPISDSIATWLSA